MRVPAFLLLLFSTVLVTVTVVRAEGLKESLTEERFDCPDGTEKVGDPPPAGTKLYCQKTFPGGEKPLLHGAYRSWYSSGEKKGEGSYNYGKPDGTFVQYFRDGTLKQKMTFANGLLDGVQERHFADGSLELKKNFKNGKLDGESESYYENGSPKFRGKYINGAPDGEVNAWYSSGLSKIQGFYHDSKQTGTWSRFYLNGKKRSEGSFSDGKADGVWTTYRADGTTRSSMRMENGKTMKVYKGEKPTNDGHGLRTLKKDESLDEHEDRRFAEWNQKVRASLNQQAKDRAKSGSEFIPTGQRAGAAYQAAQDRKEHLAAYDQYRIQRRADAEVANENTPMRGLFDVSERNRKIKQEAEDRQ